LIFKSSLFLQNNSIWQQNFKFSFIFLKNTMAFKIIRSITTKLHQQVTKQFHTQMMNTTSAPHVPYNKDPTENQHRLSDPKCVKIDCKDPIIPLPIKQWPAKQTSETRDSASAYKPCMCPEPVRPKMCLEITQAPEPKRRPRKKIQKKEDNPCESPPVSMLAKPCVKVDNDESCPKIVMPGCKPAKSPPRCTEKYREIVKCTRVATPFPSYSECPKDPPPEERKTECGCLDQEKLPLM
jgi:hypothetical protein